MEKLRHQLGVKLLLLSISIILVGFGAYSLVQSGIGGDAVLVFQEGISVFTGIELGLIIMVINAVMTIFLFLVNRSMINIGTLAFIFLLGPMVTLFSKISLFPVPTSFIESLAIFLIASVVVTFGISLYLYADVGYTAFEGLLIEIKDRTNIRFAYIKIVSDVFLFIIGILLGGTFGWGSVISVFIFGPLIDLYVNLLKKTKIIKKTSNK